MLQVAFAGMPDAAQTGSVGPGLGPGPGVGVGVGVGTGVGLGERGGDGARGSGGVRTRSSKVPTTVSADPVIEVVWVPVHATVAWPVLSVSTAGCASSPVELVSCTATSGTTKPKTDVVCTVSCAVPPPIGNSAGEATTVTCPTVTGAAAGGDVDVGEAGIPEQPANTSAGITDQAKREGIRAFCGPMGRRGSAVLGEVQSTPRGTRVGGRPW